MKRKPRISKKLHRWWLEFGVIDASQQSYWRQKLFNAPYFTEFVIDADHCDGLTSDVIAALKKYELSYRVAKVPASEAESWLSEDGFVVFKFWATDYPEVCMFSGNNPAAR